jgi:hypothetical protein
MHPLHSHWSRPCSSASPPASSKGAERWRQVCFLPGVLFLLAVVQMSRKNLNEGKLPRRLRFWQGFRCPLLQRQQSSRMRTSHPHGCGGRWQPAAPCLPPAALVITLAHACDPVACLFPMRSLSLVTTLGPAWPTSADPLWSLLPEGAACMPCHQLLVLMHTDLASGVLQPCFDPLRCKLVSPDFSETSSPWAPSLWARPFPRSAPCISRPS